MSQTKQFCTFFLNGLCFGVEVLNVQEVLRGHHRHRAADKLAGVERDH